MPVERIRIRYNGRSIELSQYGIENASGAPPVCQNTVAVLMKNDIRRFVFKGFIDVSNEQLSLNYQLCKCIDIISYYRGIGNFEQPVSISLKSYCVAVYENDGVYLLKRDNTLISYPLN